MSDLIELDVDELVQLCAVDSELYVTTFFPRTARQGFAPMHRHAWGLMESDARLVNLLMYRGSAKTSNARLYTTKRIAYRMARTILYIGKSEGHAIRSTNWLKSQVEQNSRWTSVYKIRQGGKWQDSEFEIIVGEGSDAFSIWTIGMGIEGSVRGINRDDYRPDLIVLDDVLDDENAHTAERRAGINKLVYGALVQSLAPEVDAPDAKLVALNTPQHKEDFAVKALKDPGWRSAVYGCFTQETVGLPVEMQESSWPERYPSPKLRESKQSYMARNELSTWLREMECRLVSPETTSFNVGWLKKYSVVPEGLLTVYAIDPVPPPTDLELQKGMHRKNFEAHAVWGIFEDKKLLLDYKLMRGHEPSWSVAQFFEMQLRWRPVRTVVDATAYQQTLVWLLQKEMERRRQWYAVSAKKFSTKKHTRIVQAFAGPGAAGRLYVRQEHVEFVEQFGQYPETPFDDLLDASSMALMELTNMYVGSGDSEMTLIGEAQEVTAPLVLRSAP